MASDPLNAAERIRFGDGFQLDTRSYEELSRAGRALKLERIPMEVLLLLVEERGHLVNRERIIERVWGKNVFLDTDNSINAAIRKIRQALADDAESPRLVQTVTGRGYRFIGDVDGPPSQPLAFSARSSPAIEPAPRAGPTRNRLALALLTIAASGSLLWLWASWRGRPSAAPLHSIAVLPLNNFSGDPSQEYFVDGMTDELTTDLAKISSLRVVSRTSAMRYKGTKKGLPEIARELNVDAIVEGSVTRSGQRVRITAQLLRAATDQHLWADAYDGDFGDVLKLQTEVAEAIAQQVRAQLAPSLKARLRPARTVNPSAYDAYLRGRYYLTTRFTMPKEVERAKSYFEDSIRRDPSFPLAHVRLADSYLYLAIFRELPPAPAYRQAKEAIREALELDGSLGEAHDTLALLSWLYDRDWTAAEREFEQALLLAPSYDCAHSDHSNYLAWSGRTTEALAEITRNRELDPSSSFAGDESNLYFQLRDFTRLVAAARNGVASDPMQWTEHGLLGIGYEGLGKRQEAIAEYQKAVEMSEGDQDASAALAHAYAALDRRPEAQKILDDLERRSTTTYVSPYMLATIYAGLGDKDRAFSLLERACQERDLNIVWNIKADLRIDNLRSDPRFQRVLSHLGLEHSPLTSSD